MKGPKLNILVAGSIASPPGQGGWTWAVLQYLLGLRRLGHDVYYLDVADPAAVTPTDGEFSPAVTYFRAVMADFGFRRASAMLLKGRQEAIGMGYGELSDL